MARKLRIQYQGAIYHVINRGNYRQNVFLTAKTVQAFEAALMEACTLSGWKLHAYVVMRNHYHLAVETPRANLVEGMHWLQSTFATRFNRLRKERGHLFQGRYQALLIEDRAALTRVVDYIHLNPIRAHVVPIEQLANFRWSSLRRFLCYRRPECLIAEDWLGQHGLPDSPSGLSSYIDYLKNLAADDSEQKRLGWEELSHGWAVGTHGWRQAVAKDHAAMALAPGIEAKQRRAMMESLWTKALEDTLAAERKTPNEAPEYRANAPWKIAVASQMRKVGASYPWIAQKLHMGSGSTARVYVNRSKK